MTAMAKPPFCNPLLASLLLAACAPTSVPRSAPSPPVSPAPPPAAAPTPTPAAPPAAAPPHLQLQLTTLPDRTGGEFGIAVPMLQLLVRNQGPGTAMVAQPGLSMLLSLRVVIARPGGGAPENRQVTLRLPRAVELQELAAGAELRQALSPLSREQRDVPLPPGPYAVRVCVIPPPDAAYPSAFTEQFGGTCSNQIEITAKKAPRTGR
jgi:hypothetical protein